MLPIAFVRKNSDAVREAIRVKNVRLDLDALLGLDAKVTALKTELQALSTEKNALSKSFQSTPKEGHAALRARSTEIGARMAEVQPELDAAEASLRDALLWVPQIPSPQTPIGPDDSGNVVVRQVGERPTFDFEPTDHVALLDKHGWAEFERVTKVSGSRNFCLKGQAVRLELAMHQLMWDKMEREGFTLITVPDLVRDTALIGTGHFPAGREDAYYLQEDDLYLAGTAEVVLTGLHSGEILEEKDLPILYAGFSPCFRREAGSFGRDVRGLLRVHQFTKTEQYVICKEDPDESARWHERLLALSEELLADLELPYQVIEVCTGDMGMGKFRMHDIETWMPSLQKYRETHSCSSLHTWQAHRANLRYRDAEGKVRHVHTLNNTAVATPRLLAPFLENHQQVDGTVRVPKALQPYLGGRASLGGR
jgi:seryl-tRNA synthetase